MNNPKFKTTHELVDLDELRATTQQQTELFYRRVMLQRENILAAFIAETGCRPSEIRQVIKNSLTHTEWYLERIETIDTELE